MEQKKLTAGLLYLGLHDLLIKKFGVNMEFDIKHLYTTLGRRYLIPKRYRCLIIKEMEVANLIKKVNKRKIMVLKGEINLDEDSNELFSIFKLY